MQAGKLWNTSKTRPARTRWRVGVGGRWSRRTYEGVLVPPSLRGLPLITISSSSITARIHSRAKVEQLLTKLWVSACSASGRSRERTLRTRGLNRTARLAPEFHSIGLTMQMISESSL